MFDLVWGWQQGPRRESARSKAVMHEHGKSDSSIVPQKPLNKDGSTVPPAEKAEGRGLTKGNSLQQNQVPDTGPG